MKTNDLLTNDDLCFVLPSRKKRGRTWIITPDGSDPVFDEIRVDNTLLRALLKANLWQRWIEKGKYETVAELSQKKNIAHKYVRQILRLNYLSPIIKEMILDGRQPKDLKLQELMNDLPIIWKDQMDNISGVEKIEMKTQ